MGAGLLVTVLAGGTAGEPREKPRGRWAAGRGSALYCTTWLGGPAQTLPSRQPVVLTLEKYASDSSNIWSSNSFPQQLISTFPHFVFMLYIFFDRHGQCLPFVFLQRFWSRSLVSLITVPFPKRRSRPATVVVVLTGICRMWSFYSPGF